MNLYLISRFDPDSASYEEWLGAVVAAEDELSARRTHPSGNSNWSTDGDYWTGSTGWVHPDDVQVQRIGTATEGTAPGVILGSYTGT